MTAKIRPVRVTRGDVIRVTTGQINRSSSKTRTFLFCIKNTRAASCVHSINVLKLEETRATVFQKFFFTNFYLDAVFVGISLRFIARDFRVDFFKARTIARF